MQSSGGVAPARGGRARAGPGASSAAPPAARSGRACSRRASGDGNALGLDMGGTSCDVCVVEEGRVRRTDSREFAGRPIQLPDGRRPHGRRRRRLDRLGATRAARCGSARARRGPSPDPPVTGAAATSRPSPTPTSCSATSGARASLAGGVELDARRRRGAPSSRLAGALGLEPVEAAAGIVEVANAEMLQRPARRHGRARDRPARVRAAPVRRRRPAARGGDRRGARDRPDPLPARRAACSRRSASSPPSAGATPPARSCSPARS